MTMNKLLSASVALLALGLSVPAKAADMPVKYVAPAPIFTWTGCYVGAPLVTSGARASKLPMGFLNGVAGSRHCRLDIAPTTTIVNGVLGGGRRLQLSGRQLGMGR